MIKNILNIVGWLGTALVVAAVAVRFLRPEWDQYAIYGAWAGLACVVLYTLGQWREIADYFSVMSFGLFLTARSVDTERWKG